MKSEQSNGQGAVINCANGSISFPLDQKLEKKRLFLTIYSLVQFCFNIVKELLIRQ